MSSSRKQSNRLKKRKYSFPDNLPELAENGTMFKFGKEIGYQGSIIRVEMEARPGLYHWGIIYGYDKRDHLWIIENTPKGILVTDFREFTAFGKLKTEYDLLHDPDKSAGIFERAKQFYKNRRYFCNRKNNCEIFVNYCYGEIEQPESQQTKIIESIAGFFVRVAEGIFVTNTKHDEQKQAGVRESFDKLRKSLGVKEK